MLDDDQNQAGGEGSPAAEFEQPDTATLEDTVNQAARQQDNAAPSAPPPVAEGQKPTFDQYMKQPDQKPAGNQKPTFDQFMKQGEPPPGFFSGEHLGEMTNKFLNHTAVGRVVDAFGYEVQDDLGGDIGLDKETIDDMTKMGLFNDWKHGEAMMSKTVGELMLQSTAVIYNSLGRAFSIASGGTGAVLSQSGKELGPVAGYPLSAAGEMATAVKYGALMGEAPGLFPHVPEEAAMLGTRGSIPHEVAQAGDVGAIGARESVYFGLEEPTPAETARIEHARTINNFYEEQERLAEPKDVHELARDMQPETFREYDALDAQKDVLRGQIKELDEQRETQLDAARSAVHQQYAAEIEELKTKADESTARGKKSVYQELLEKKIAERDEAVSKIAAEGDTPQMAALREQIMKADERMRDMSTSVASAYREAQQRIAERPERVKIEPAEDTLSPDMKPAEVLEHEKAKPPAELRPADTKIEEDFARNAIKAGRPAEEAHAVAQIVGAHYRTMSELFEGKLGTPMEVYTTHIPKLKSIMARSGIKVKELAQEEDVLRYDNPGGDWLAKHRRYSEEMISKKSGFRGSTGPVTAWTKKYIDFPVEEAVKIPGEMNEKRVPGEAQFDELMAKVKEEGFQRHSPISIHVNYRGEPYITEGNTRVAVAKALGIDTIPAEVKYHAGGEEAAGALSPSRLNELLSTLNQSAKGGIQLAGEGARATIKLFQSANASTLIHELGHHFFDELVRFSEHPEAPASMKADVATLREYVGDKGGEFSGFSRGAHEKIARGFERYLMEGTAPSKALGRVFGKFKQWLGDIYQTVQKLRSPITDDVRAVFDRMLATNPEKTIIAPERGAGEHLANIHEQDALETPPAHAAEVRDSIRKESDYLAKLYDPEVFNEINEPEKAAEQPAAPSENPTPATTAGESAGAGGATQQPSPVSPGGDSAGAKGGAARGADAGTPRAKTGGGSGDAEGSSKQPTSAGAKFRRQDTDLVDKAGNIRLDNLNTPEDVNQVLKDTAENNGDFLGARRGVISVGQQLELADALGMNPSILNFRKIGEAFNAEQILAARKLLIQSATNVRDLMMKGKNATEQEVKAYAEAVQRHLMIQEHVAGLTAEAGRALGAFRALEGAEEAKSMGQILKDTTGKTLYQLQQEMEFGKNLQTPAQVAKFLDAGKKAGFKKMVLEYYINCLISGPVTHFRYSVGNAINALWTPLFEAPAAATVGAARQLLTGSAEDRIYYGEALAQLHGLLRGSRDGLYAAATAFKTGVSPGLPGEHMSQAFSDMQSMGPAIPGTLGKVINLPSKSVSAIHSFFKSIRYEQNIQSIAYRTAMKEGLEGAAFKDRVGDLSLSPTEAMMEEATSGALRELFMSPTDYNSTMGTLNRAINNSLPAKIIVPFMKIGSQITRNAFMDRSVLGLLGKETREGATYQRGGAAGDMALGKMAVGTALVGTMVGLTLEGMATGDGPEDPAQRAIWLLNHKPNTLTVGGITIPYQGLGPLGMLMRFSANMTETASHWTDEDGLTLAKHFMEGISKSVLDENFMRGVKDMLDAVYHPEEYGVPYVRSFITNWLPFSVGMSQVARKTDPYMRDINTNNPAVQQIIDTARSKIPGMSSDLAPKRDRFGEAIPNGGISSQYLTDPVIQKMESLHIGIGKLNREILGIKLTDQQYDDYSRLAGRLTKQRLDQLVKNPGFSNLAEGTQIMVIKKAVETSRENARNMLIVDPTHPENRNILRQAIEKKRQALRGEKH